jgi:hypothetical protein
MRKSAFLTLSIAAALAVVCGGGNTNAPSSPTPAALGISIVGADVVFLGSTATYSVTVRFANGDRINDAMPTSWNTDSPDVATIDAAGRLTPRRAGTTTITATHQGKTAKAIVRVPANNHNPGGANLVLSFRPDPVPGSPSPCPGTSLPRTPTWSFTAVTTETQGVGFSLKAEGLSLYDEAGQFFFGDMGPDEDYLPGRSSVSNEICLSLLGQPSGFFTVVFEGVDDHGNQVTFASHRVRLLPVTGSSAATFNRGSPAALPVGGLIR